MHFEADDLSAVHIQNDGQIKPLTDDSTRQEREIPTPQLSRSRSHVSARWSHSLRRFVATSMTNLSLRSQYTSEAGFAGNTGAVSADVWICGDVWSTVWGV